MIDISEARQCRNAFKESILSGLLSDALDELEASRTKIAIMSDLIGSKLSAIPSEEKDQIILDLKTKLDKAIIPREGDAQIFKDLIVTLENAKKRCPVHEDLHKAVMGLLFRYLAAIEVPCQKQ